MRDAPTVTTPVRRNEPRVNLLRARPRNVKRMPRTGKGVLVLAALAAVSWGVAAVGIAMLLGWHPTLGVGP